MTLSLWILIGLCFGSFAAVCAHRLPRDVSVVAPRSFCPRCRTPLRWRDNLPVVGYLLRRGRCFSCREPISPRYPLMELASGALFAAAYLRLGDDLFLAAVGAAVGWTLLVLTVIDLEHQIIPDSLPIALLVLGLASAPFQPRLGATPLHRVAAALAGAAVGGGLFLAVARAGRSIWKKDALGGGDVKLMAGAGTLLGWQGVFFTVLIGSLTGTLVALGMMARRRLDKGSYIAFGPFLALGIWLWCLGWNPLGPLWPF
jgi:leader peptidase (prepilin peptidase)/N-methyltransferase